MCVWSSSNRTGADFVGDRWMPPFTSGLHRRRMSSTPHTTRRCATTRKGEPPFSYFPVLFVEFRAREQDLHRQVSLLKDQLRDLRVSNESTEARLLDQSQRLGKFSFQFGHLHLIVARPGGGCEARRDGHGCCRIGACKYQGGYRRTS